MVTFSPDLPYAKALKNGRKQEKIMQKVMKHIETEADFDKPEVQEIIREKMETKLGVKA